MSELPEQWAFLPTGWRAACLFTGCRIGASRVFREAVEEVLRHPGTGNPHRARVLFYATLRRRALRYPAICELTGVAADLHGLPEPGRGALAFFLLKALSEDEMEHVMEMSERQIAGEVSRTRSSLQKSASISPESQQDFDGEISASLAEIVPDAEAEKEIADAAHALATRQSSHRISARNPATLAVGLGFLLLIAVLTWHFLGEAGLFPDEAVKIATIGATAGPEQFDPVDNDAGQLRDWFMLKGFDDFQLPAGLEGFHVAGVRLFKFENEAIAQAAISENTMFFYAFASHPLGIDVVPERIWRVTQADRWVLAIREEKGVCFMIAFRGTKADMERVLSKSAQ